MAQIGGVPRMIRLHGCSRLRRRRSALRLNVELLEGGTLLSLTTIKDINPAPAFPAETTDVGGTLYFTTRAADGGTNLDKWTAGGVTVLKDFTLPSGEKTSPYSHGSTPAISHMTAAGKQLFFVANGGSGPALWVTNGTTDGTRQLTDVDGTEPVTQLDHLTSVAGKLFFTTNAASPANGFRLWVSNGTASGLTSLSSFSLPPTHAYFAGSFAPPRSVVKFAAYHGALYFANGDPAHGNELWKSDGTVGGTKRLADINLGTASSFPTNLAVSAGTLYFAASGTTGANQLWKLDAQGNPARIERIRPGD